MFRMVMMLAGAAGAAVVTAVPPVEFGKDTDGSVMMHVGDDGAHRVIVIDQHGFELMMVRDGVIVYPEFSHRSWRSSRIDQTAVGREDHVVDVQVVDWTLLKKETPTAPKARFAEDDRYTYRVALRIRNRTNVSLDQVQVIAESPIRGRELVRCDVVDVYRIAPAKFDLALFQFTSYGSLSPHELWFRLLKVDVGG